MPVLMSFPGLSCSKLEGKQTDVEEYSSIRGVIYNTMNELNSKLDFVSRFVLSAGHCFEGIRNGEPITITLGEHDTERRENSEVVLEINYRPGFNVFVHDKYDAPGNKVSLNLTF